jgi:hypothetical protein
LLIIQFLLEQFLLELFTAPGSMCVLRCILQFHLTMSTRHGFPSMTKVDTKPILEFPSNVAWSNHGEPETKKAPIL